MEIGHGAAVLDPGQRRRSAAKLDLRILVKASARQATACRKTALTTITMEEAMQIDRRELTVSALALVTLSALRAGLGCRR
jgi:hypothetical protein